MKTADDNFIKGFLNGILYELFFIVIVFILFILI